MIEHCDLKRFAHADKNPCEMGVLRAGTMVAGWMIMRQQERLGIQIEGMFDNVPRSNFHFCFRTMMDLLVKNQVVPVAKEEYPHLLGCKR